jgi:hypothetical protein
MSQWEYLTRDWRFVGPGVDDWPGRAAYEEGLARQRAAREGSNQALVSSLLDFSSEDEFEGPEGERLAEEYVAWRERAELEYLNEIGAAGFELVSVSREIMREFRAGRHTTFLHFPVIRTHAFFKRTVEVDAPEPPHRTIGFAAPDI